MGPMKMLVTSFDRNPERLAELAQQHGVEFVVPPEATHGALMGDVDALYGQSSADEFASASSCAGCSPRARASNGCGRCPASPTATSW